MAFFALGFFQLFVASQALLASLFLLGPGRRSRPGRAALGSLLALLGVHLGIEASQRLAWLEPGVTPTDLFGLLYGPLFLLFVRDLAFRPAATRSFWVGHFVPFVAGLATLTWDVVPPEAFAGLVWISLAVYLSLSLRILARYRRILASTRSDADRVALGWLRYSIFGLIGVLVLDVSSFAFGRALGASRLDPLPWALFGFLLLYVYGFVAGVLRHDRLFGGVSKADQRIAEAAEAEPSPGATDAEAVELARIESRMVEARLHLEPQITLAELAERLAVPPRRLSELVNGIHGRNFSDWINGWRVEEAQRLLASEADAHRNVLDILLDAGFNSKSTFNAVFKVKTGMTPTQYRRRERDG